MRRDFPRQMQAVFYVFVAGRSEEKYFNEVLRVKGKPLQVVRKDARDPLGLVKFAHRYLTANRTQFDAELDQVWIICDRDSQGRPGEDDRSYLGAYREADRRGYFFGYSNDCFELWYLLHFVAVERETSRRDLLARLEKAMGAAYVKPYPLSVAVHHSGWEIAAMRADMISEAANRESPDSPCLVNPSTNIHALVRAYLGVPYKSLETDVLSGVDAR